VADNLGSIGRGTVDVSVPMAGFDRSMRSITDQLRALGSRVVRIPVDAAALSALASGARASVREAVGLETLLVGLRKAADVSDEGFRALRDQLFGLSTTLKGISIENLIEIATSGAKLGIAAPEVGEFAKAIAMVASAMDDIPAKEIADQLGKLNVIFKLGTAGFAQLGSAIDKLADSGVSSASGILNVTQRISGSAVAAKLSAQEALALSAALLDTGTNSELAASSLLHLIQKLNDLKAQAGFARVIGVSAKEFAATVRASPLRAVLDFLDAVKKLNAGSQDKAFEAIGIKGDQAVGELQKLSQQADSIRKYIGLANDEFRTLNQLQESYNLTAGTSAANFEAFGNQLKILQQNVGGTLLPTLTAGLGLIGDFAVGFGESLDRTRQIVEGWGIDVSYYLESVGRILRNLPDYLAIVGIRMAEFAINTGNQFGALFENIRRLGEWFSRNWTGLLIDALNVVGRSIINLGKNFADFGASIFEFLKDPTKGFQFKPTELLKDFQAEASALPDLVSPAVTSLQDQVDERLKGIDDREKGRQAQLGQPALRPPGAGGPAGAGAGGGGKFEGATKATGGTFGLEEYARRLQEGAFGKKDPVQAEIAGNGKRAANGIDRLNQVMERAVKGGIAAVAT
jgi:TP901 family phage tail tape measure protein